ncbi:Glycosyltransferase involved in cell wall bisynthesis [Nocardioides alpinus]|uniref:Glycosyltransferase family 2 protein n=1 Tax=Nocardioides alpinus TaxID=748909 RepID=A0A1I0VRV7_9ACTN|nr:glycosyltransferase family 2 protein [Nocardioides alpinus]SFA79135.1 Glycosyltransferase involved in cell wall bisynthesis [Nocardioides alpinus]
MRFHSPRALGRTPRVSVVIPCYNYGRYLPAAVASALDQQGLDVDVLVVDDASPDGSHLVAQELAASDPRVDVLVHDNNAGHIQTYNDGLTRAEGDYVVLLSADDLLPRNALTRAIGLMEAHPSVGLVYGYARSFTDRPDTVTDETRNWSVWPGRQWLRRSARSGRCFLVSPEAVMRREALFETDLYDPRLPHSGDFDMWLRTAARWDVGRVNGPIQAHYRVHDANMHLTSYAGWLTDLEARRRTFDILFDERAADVAEVVALRPVAMKALAREAMRRSRLAHRGAGWSDDEAAAYLQFASETWPGSERSWTGRATRLLLEQGRLPAVQARELGTRVRHHVEWRRERRWGV